MQRQVCLMHNVATEWLMRNRDPNVAERVCYRAGRSLVDFYARAMLNMDVQWQASLPAGPKILAANHPTTTDPFLIMLLAAEQVSVLVTGGCFQIPLFGRLLLESGHVPVLRGTGGASVDAAVRLLAEGRTVAIFPEGAISPAEGGMHAARSGVARLALRTGVPVIPVGIGLDRRRIRRLDTRVDGKPEVITWYARGPYSVTVGRPLRFHGDVHDWVYVRSVSESIMCQVAALARESDRRVAQALVEARQLGAATVRALKGDA